MAGSVSPLTERVYRSSWKLFRAWCTRTGRVALPSSPDVLSLYVAWCVREQGYRLTSVRAHVAAVRYKHRVGGFPSPVDASVRDLLSAFQRQLKEAPVGRLALTASQLSLLSAMLDSESSTIASRDRALLVVGFALGWRGSELARLRVSDVVCDRRGLRVHQRWSKTDQLGKGRDVGVPPGSQAGTCPVAAFGDWMKVRGGWDGPVFCVVRKDGSVVDTHITGGVVNQVLQGRMRQAGLSSDGYGSHSLRAGCVTASAEAGATETAIMQRTGHKSIEMILRYTRPARVFANDPLAGVL